MNLCETSELWRLPLQREERGFWLHGKRCGLERRLTTALGNKRWGILGKRRTLSGRWDGRVELPGGDEPWVTSHIAGKGPGPVVEAQHLQTAVGWQFIKFSQTTLLSQHSFYWCFAKDNGTSELRILQSHTIRTFQRQLTRLKPSTLSGKEEDRQALVLWETWSFKNSTF